MIIPEGDFLMGSSARREDEKPVHNVYINAFEMAVTPVTNGEYRYYSTQTGADLPPWIDEPEFYDDRQPVVGVNWNEARAYCQWLSEESDLTLRLPTEAEREKATRGGKLNQLFPWGEDIAGGGHKRLNGPLNGPEPVGTGNANNFGLYNLADTVHEWCLDAYLPRFYENSPERNPCAFGTPRRVARGGSWRHQIVVTPSSSRSSLPPTLRYTDFGFRWVRELGC